IAQSNIDPGDAGLRYAWSENAGWLNARPLGAGGPGAVVTDFALTGWLWAENAGWINLSCRNRGTCAAAPFGVVNDGQGHLSGFAWGENVGWIDFGPAGAGVTIDPATGIFSGSAWGENVGWISFAGTSPVAFAIETAWRCSPAPPAPAGAPQLTLHAVAEGTRLDWTALPGATAYDVVRGDLGTLALSGGDFGSAVTGCDARRIAASTLLTTLTPSPAGGFFYLVRGANCGAAGTFDSGGPGQAGSRDGEIAGSPNRCP
ncbi:MAG: hypothetical protein MUE47_08555, partial [Acidobacteria bacterium]|nr:hypothetical protein [Acidobacteriota bacterium]